MKIKMSKRIIGFVLCVAMMMALTSMVAAESKTPLSDCAIHVEDHEALQRVADFYAVTASELLNLGENLTIALQAAVAQMQSLLETQIDQLDSFALHYFCAEIVVPISENLNLYFSRTIKTSGTLIDNIDTHVTALRTRHSFTDRFTITNIFNVTIITLNSTGEFERWQSSNRWVGQAVNRIASYQTGPMSGWSIVRSGSMGGNSSTEPWVNNTFSGQLTILGIPSQSFSVSNTITFFASDRNFWSQWR